MKKFLPTAIVAIILAITLLFIVSTVQAEDVALNTIVDQVVIAIDKNGNEYVRVIVVENLSLKGIRYDAGVPVMFFGNLSERAKTLKKGDTLKVIANKRMWQGNYSYTARAFID